MNESEIERENASAPIPRKLERESEHYEEKRSDGCLPGKDGEAKYRLFEYVGVCNFRISLSM